MKPPSLLLLISCFLLKRGHAKDEFVILEPGKLKVANGDTYYFRSDDYENKDIPQVCSDHRAVVCLVDKDGKAKIINAGSLNSLTFSKESKDRFSYTFDKGEKCGDDGQSYKTRFDFFCPEPDEEISHSYVLSERSNQCNLNFFVWHRGENCPRQVSDGCQLNIPEFEQRLDLSVMKSDSYFDVFSADKTKHFHLNICGGIKGSPRCSDNVTICNVTNESESKVLFDKDPVTLSTFDPESQRVKLQYLSKGSYKNEFTFVCEDNENNVDPFIQFTDEKDDEKGIKTLHFLVRSKSVCLSKPSDCTYVDEDSGKRYDLTSLRQPYAPWTAFDTRPEMKARQYHLSICKPLFPSFAKCPGSMTSVCLTHDTESRVLANQGQFSKFEVKDDALILSYESGASCNAKYSYLSQIIFRCNDMDEGPKLFDSLDNCTYIFEWKTPVACPVQDFTTRGCLIKDEHYGHTFNLSGLHNPDSDFKVEEDFQMNVCGPLKNEQICGKDASICHGDKIIGITSSEQLLYDTELGIVMRYDGAKCENGLPLTTIIYLHCDQKAGRGRPVFVLKDICYYEFMWKTTLACPPFDEVECITRDENDEIFDFSSLARNDTNYEVSGLTNGKIVMNLCRSLVHKANFKCPYKSAACLKETKDGKDVFTSLGQINQGPYLDEHNRMVIKYTNGGVCKNQHTSETHMTTKIILNCRMDKKDSQPTFLQREGCTFVFWWDHYAACPTNFSHLITQDSCMVTDEKSGHVFDFRGLQTLNRDLKTVDDSGNTFYLGICSKPSDETIAKKCGSKSAACMKDSKGDFVNIGNVNDRLTFQAGEPVLHYDSESYHTSIHFKCAPHRFAQEGQLVLLKNIKNQFYFDYHTTLACLHTVHCVASQDDSEFLSYDLSPLKNYDEDVKLRAEKSTTIISVCKPINEDDLEGCLPGSAICKKVYDPKKKVKEAISYGVPVKSPRVVHPLDLVIDYEGGSTCQEDEKRRYNSSISFSCAPTIYPGKPELASVTHGGCHLNYKWETMVACPNQSLPVTFDTPEDCQVVHPWNKMYSLDAFRSKKDVVIDSPTDSQDRYFIQPCGMASKCKSSICIRHHGQVFDLGNVTSSSFEMDEQMLRVHYQGDKVCKDSLKWSAEIRFMCDLDVREAKVDLLYEGECHPVFTWTSFQVCSSFAKKDDNLVEVHSSAAASSSSSSSTAWGIAIFAMFCMIMGFVIFRKPHNREFVHEKVSQWSRNLFKRRRDEDQNLLVQNVTIPTFGGLEGTDDDDDLIIA